MVAGRIVIEEVNPPRSDDEIYEAMHGHPPEVPYKEDEFKRTLRVSHSEPALY